MSRIGKKPILIPSGVKFDSQEDKIIVTGPLGIITVGIPSGFAVEQKDSNISVLCRVNSKEARVLHGTLRQIVYNAVRGVAEGWKKELEIRGTGFKVLPEGESLVLSLGFSHPVKVSPPESIKFSVKENKVTIIGPDKAKVGLLADKIRKIYPPDSYKGKGIRYLGEQIILKPGKAAKVGTAQGTTA